MGDMGVGGQNDGARAGQGQVGGVDGESFDEEDMAYEDAASSGGLGGLFRQSTGGLAPTLATLYVDLQETTRSTMGFELDLPHAWTGLRCSYYTLMKTHEALGRWWAASISFPPELSRDKCRKWRYYLLSDVDASQERRVFFTVQSVRTLYTSLSSRVKFYVDDHFWFSFFLLCFVISFIELVRLVREEPRHQPEQVE